MESIKFEAAGTQLPTAVQMNHNRGSSPFEKNNIRFHLGGQYLTNFTDEGIADFIRKNAPRDVKLDSGDVKLFIQRVAENAESARGVAFNLADPDLKLSKNDGIDGDKWKAAFSLTVNKEGNSTPEVAFVDVTAVSFDATAVKFDAAEPGDEVIAPAKDGESSVADPGGEVKSEPAKEGAAEGETPAKTAPQDEVIVPPQAQPQDEVIKPTPQQEAAPTKPEPVTEPLPTPEAFKALSIQEKRVQLVGMDSTKQDEYLALLSPDELKALQTTVNQTLAEYQSASSKLEMKGVYEPKYKALKEKIDAKVAALPASDPPKPVETPPQDPKPADTPPVDEASPTAPVQPPAEPVTGSMVTKDNKPLEINGKIITYENFASLSAGEQFRVLMRTDEAHVETLLRTLKSQPSRLSQIKGMAGAVISGYEQKMSSADTQQKIHDLGGYGKFERTSQTSGSSEYSGEADYKRAKLIVSIIEKIEAEIAAEQGSAPSASRTVTINGQSYALKDGEEVYTVRPGQTAEDIAKDFYQQDQFEVDEIFKHQFNQRLLANMIARTQNAPYKEPFDPAKGDPAQIILPKRPTGNPMAGVTPRQPTTPVTNAPLETESDSPPPQAPPPQAPKRPAD